MSDFAIRVTNLAKCYNIYNSPGDRLKQFILPRIRHVVCKNEKQYFREFWALKDVSFEIKKGETVGIIGRNGSGKSTLLQLICGTLNPTTGSIQTNGRVAALLELGSGFNPEFTGRENIYLNGSILGFSQREIDERLDSILDFADIGDFIDQPVKTYSSGMYVRLAFSIQANVDPDILIIDEALAVGDAYFVHRCMERFNQLKMKGVTIIFVSHDASSVKRLCNKAIYLHAGGVAYYGDSTTVVDNYLRDVFLKCSSNSKLAIDDREHEMLDIVKNSKSLRYDSRAGDQHLEIILAALNTESDAEIDSIEWSELLNLRIEIRNNNSDINGVPVSVGYILRDPKGIEIASTNSRVEGFDIRAPHTGGHIVVDFSIMIPMLHPGVYSISPSVSTIDAMGGFTVRDRLINALMLTIVARGEIYTPMRLSTAVRIIYKG